MAAKFVVFVALLALASAGIVKRDAPEANNELKQDIDKLLQQMSVFSASFQKVIAEGTDKAKDTAQATKESIDKAVADLRRNHPEVEQNASKLNDQVKTALAAGVTEVKRIAEEVQKNAEGTYQKLAPSIKESADNIVKNVVDLQKKFQESTKQ